jgi:serine/threonine protein kinase
MEYLELGDLYQHLYDKPPLPEREAKEIAFQILEGLDMMHENDFAHRDLKPRVSRRVSRSHFEVLF